jgi:DNA-directed RNA polymerase subunit K/omega
MTREELQKTYSKLSVQELLEIVDNKFDYTETAVKVALEEIAKRNISETDIKDYKTEQIEKVTKVIKQYILDDLTLIQKNFFFFIWIPLVTFPFKQNFSDDGYILKLKQANYYSLLGFIFFMITGIASAVYDLANLTSLGIWILSFLPAYSFDEFFNRGRQIKKLKKIIRSRNNGHQPGNQKDIREEFKED